MPHFLLLPAATMNHSCLRGPRELPLVSRSMVALSRCVIPCCKVSHATKISACFLEQLPGLRPTRRLFPEALSVPQFLVSVPAQTRNPLLCVVKASSSPGVPPHFSGSPRNRVPLSACPCPQGAPDLDPGSGDGSVVSNGCGLSLAWVSLDLSRVSRWPGVTGVDWGTQAPDPQKCLFLPRAARSSHSRVPSKQLRSKALSLSRAGPKGRWYLVASDLRWGPHFS